MKLETIRDGTVCTVKVAGRVVLENQGELRAELEKLIEEGCLGIVLDLAEVDYMDSAALGCCAASYKQIQVKGGAMAVLHASPTIEKLWKMIHLDRVIPLCGDAKEALAHLHRDD